MNYRAEKFNPYFNNDMVIFIGIMVNAEVATVYSIVLISVVIIVVDTDNDYFDFYIYQLS